MSAAFEVELIKHNNGLRIHRKERNIIITVVQNVLVVGNGAH